MSTVTSKSGKVAPVCQDCGRRGAYATPSPSGRVDLFAIGAGWSIAPYPAHVVHADGTTGDQYHCPECVAGALHRNRTREGDSDVQST